LKHRASQKLNKISLDEPYALTVKLKEQIMLHVTFDLAL